MGVLSKLIFSNCSKIVYYYKNVCYNYSVFVYTLFFQKGILQSSMGKEERAARRRKKDKRKVRTIPPMSVIVPFIMVNRNGSSNYMKDTIPTIPIDAYIKQKHDEGMEHLTLMHVIIAAYVRLVSQRPQINRFIRGQRVWTRRSIEVALTIKKEMTMESPDTVIKVIFQPTDTIKEVYERMEKAITDYRNDPGGDFDDTARWLSYIPSLFLKFVIWLLKTLDYFGLLPRFLEGVSPFHCSMFITSMGSLGIPAIYHHLYDFGTCPLFISFGAKKREYRINPDGSVYKDQFVDISCVCDERICDGFYYASSLKLLKFIMKKPQQLDLPPEQVIEDID